MQLSESERHQLAKIHESWSDLRKNFVVPGKIEGKTKEEIYKRDIINIAENVDIRIPLEYTSHRLLLGPIIVFVKHALQRLVQPIIKIALHRQIIVNHHVLNLSSQMADMEMRLKKLEERLSK